MNLFGIDPRSLALFRMGVGVLLLADLIIRATDLSVMYTDDGMFPRAEICRRVTSIWNWSFHFGSGSWEYQAMLFGIALFLALALFAGYETRMATIGSWLMLVSLHHRVPPILSGADVLLRMLLFWGMFLPLHRAWSVDNWLRKRRGDLRMAGTESRVVSVASAAILLQMALMYLFSAIFKSNDVWVRGEAVASILAHDFYASPLSSYLRQFSGLTAAMTWGTLVLEWIAPLLLFCPLATARLRLVLVASLAVMHTCISMTLEVSLFSPVSLAGLALFLPSEFWNHRWVARITQTAERVRPLPGADDLRTTQRPALKYATQGVCLVLLLFVILTNINTLPGHPLASEDPVKRTFLRTACGLGQKWNMFEVVPSKSGWYIAWAKLKDGSEVDLLRQGAPLDWSKPQFPGGMYPNHRWRKCFREMAYDDVIGYQVFRAPVARFLCRDWNVRNTAERQIVEFDLIYCMRNDQKAAGQLASQIISRERLVHFDFSGSEGEGTMLSAL